MAASRTAAICKIAMYIWDIYIDILDIYGERNMASRGQQLCNRSNMNQTQFTSILEAPYSTILDFLDWKCLPYQPRSTGTTQLCRAARDKGYSLSQCGSVRPKEPPTKKTLNGQKMKSYSDLKSSRENVGLSEIWDFICVMWHVSWTLKPHCLGILNAMGWGEHIVQLWPMWQRSRRSDHWGWGLLFSGWS